MCCPEAHGCEKSASYRCATSRFAVALTWRRSFLASTQGTRRLPVDTLYKTWAPLKFFGCITQSLFTMRRYIALLHLAACLLHCTAAFPDDPSSGHKVETRSLGKILAPSIVGLYLCVDADWKGQCAYLENGPGLCSTSACRIPCKPAIDFSSADRCIVNLNETFAKAVSAIGPDKDRVSGCKMFE